LVNILLIGRFSDSQEKSKMLFHTSYFVLIARTLISYAIKITYNGTKIPILSEKTNFLEISLKIEKNVVSLAVKN